MMISYTDTFKIECARYLMRYLLVDKVDAKGGPLVAHCERVAAEVASQGGDADAICVAYLHDVLEGRRDIDCMGGLEDAIGEIFTCVVSICVHTLTRSPDQSYSEYIDYIDAQTGDMGKICRTVKIADLRDNLREPVPGDLEKRYRKAIKILEG